MNLTPRPYAGSQDFHHLDDILVAGEQAGGPVYYVHPGDIRWWLYYTFPDQESWSDLYLWEDDHGRVLAWSLLSFKEEALDLFCRPELHGTPEMARMLAWIMAQMAPRLQALNVERVTKDWVGPDDQAQIAILEGLGFTRLERVGVQLRRPLNDPLPEPQLPPGFCVRSSRGLAELESRAACQHSAFESEISMDRYLERFRHFVASPAYQPDEDVVVEAPDGRIVAFAKIWPDARLRSGNFEPVGVHADYQRRGLGRAVMLEGLRRLQGWGMTQAHVGTGADNEPAVRLYEAVGFHVATSVLHYTHAV